MNGFDELYLHVPFCVRRCLYCDFHTAATNREDPIVSAYCSALEESVKKLSQTVFDGTLSTVYIGGGTPTHAGDALVSLASCVTDVTGGVTEFSCEANPESLTSPMVDKLARSGVTRVSLGVQSLIDEELAVLGRAHDRKRALDAMHAVRERALDLSCDVMLGIPLQSGSSLTHTLEDIAELGADHVSCYPLTVEENTPLYHAVEAGELADVDPDVQADLMLLAHDVLSGYGFSRYEVASYARKGKVCRHNLGYWNGSTYLGLGAHASSMSQRDLFLRLAQTFPMTVASLDSPAQHAGAATCDDATAFVESLDASSRIRWTIACDARTFVESVAKGLPIPCDIEVLDSREASLEDIMLALRTTRGVSADLLGRAQQLGVDGASLLAVFRELLGQGLVERTPDAGFAPTREGWLLGNRLFGAIWDLAFLES